MVGKSLFLPIKRKIDYLVNYRGNTENVKNEVENLRLMKEHVQLLIDEARRKGEVLDPVVQDWITRVDNIEFYTKRLDNEVIEDKRCFKGCFPDCSSRYRSSKVVKKKIIVINELQSEGNFSTVSYPPPPPSELGSVGEFEAFTSQKLAIEKIIEALNDEQISIIGVCGMGGVGKTTLVKEVGKQLKAEKVFNCIVMVTVSRNLNVKDIQGKVAEKLGMKLEEESLSQRASRLFMRVKQEKRILIILDDLWGRLELHEVGIPYGKDHNGCKIVLTTRSAGICNEMECQQEIIVGVLSEQDSWNFFRREVGCAVYSPTLWDTAWKVAQECGGFPIAIVALGRALRNKDEPLYWTDALLQLKRSIQPTVLGVHAKVFTSLRLCYDSLESEEMKLFFLLCCLFPEDYKIDVNLLMAYGMAEEFLMDINTLEEARGRVSNLVDKLKAFCLLLDGNADYSDDDDNEESFVKLHDVVRDVSMTIASEDGHGYQVKEGEHLKRLKTEKFGGCKRISLMNCGIVSLGDNWPENPHLLSLLLRDNKDLMKISDSFFESMRSLVVLDLSSTSISSLPSSLSSLVNLRALFLDRCHLLTDISILGRLKKLEMIRLKWSGIHQVTEEIRQLTNLMLLDLRGTRNLKRVAPNVISALSRLEELYMDGSFREWEFERMEDGGKASLTEVGCLSCLNLLYIDIKDEEFLSMDISGPWRTLKRFHVSVGYSSGYEDNEQFRRVMRVHGMVKPISHWGRVLMEKTDKLSLERCNIDGMENLRKFIFGSLRPAPLVPLRFLCTVHCMKLITIFPSELQRTLCNLETVLVLSCEKVQVIFCCEEGREQEQVLLCRLRQVILFDLKNLKSIWKGPIPHGSAHNLQVLQVVSCKGLRFLFSPVMAQSIEKLERLELFACSSLEKLISDEEEEVKSVADATSSKFSQLNERNSTKYHPTATFQNLRVLEIAYNRALKSLFSLSLAQALLHLNKLKISCCYGMEEIISNEDGDVVDNGIFPRLRNLHLETVPHLVRFYGGEILLDWASLECISIFQCPNLKWLPIGLQSAPKLETMKVEMAWFRQLEWKEHGVKERLQPIAEEYKPWEV
ncbi:hypothetical protein AAC387_Pa10g0794 [Persea americana]|eukprot:TRINITY_DN9475_c0_g1_i1.p1 TRINITY_DN9475_c0_g1~~TRINITY_DN9475_c0_g1_i1.p1  ORF type:complete len:1086 (-),score=189.19 TRINITY_DN9475_c0_g1_i1:270-3527(-)